MDLGVGLSSRKLVECRICHDEDEESNMETPCACCGSLKYAHRRCVQRWCNEKGDTICEICLQQFKPGYATPPPLFHFSTLPVHLRGNWEIPRGNQHNPHFISMVGMERNFLAPTFDEHPASTSRSLLCFRIVAIIVLKAFACCHKQFMVLLVLRHTLPFIVSGAGDYSFTLYTLLFLRTIGILLPIFIILRACTAIQHRRRHQQVRNFQLSSSDEENEVLQPQPQLHLITVP
ncbi:hypothetical protein Ancab_006364 [Ancistrocladus abbreviatus]